MADAQLATDLVDDLMYEPPRDAVELEHRLGEVSPEQLRAVLVERLEEGRLDEIDALVAGRVFKAIGLGEGRDQLVELVSEAGESEEAERARQAAFAVLSLNPDFQKDPSELLGLERDRYVDIAASVYSGMFEFTEVNVDVVRDFGGMFLGEPEALRQELFERIESHRHETDLQAGLVYRPLIEDDRYAELWPRLVDAIVDEGVAEDATWLARRAGQVDGEDGERFQRAADKLRSEGPVERTTPAGYTLVGTPDGAGIFPLFVFIERDDGRGYDGYHLAFRHDTHQVHEGFVLRDVMDREIDELVEDIGRERATWFTEASVDVGLELIGRELDRADQPFAHLPPETRLALYLLERLPHQKVDLPEVEPADGIDAQVVRSTFQDDDCFDSWFFDRGLLESAGTPPVPAPGESADAWKEQARPAIADLEGVGARIADNVELMATWYRLDGDSPVASQLVAVAEAAREDFAGSLALDLLLDHTIEAMRQMQEYASSFLVDLLGDESLRAELRQRHFGEESSEEKRETLLDHAETAFRTLEEIGPELPDRLRPSREEMLEVAGPLGAVTAGAFEGPDEAAGNQLAQAISDEILDAGIDLRVAGLLTSELLTNARLLAMLER